MHPNFSSVFGKKSVFIIRVNMANGWERVNHSVSNYGGKIVLLIFIVCINYFPLFF